MMHRHVTDTGQEQFELGGSGLLYSSSRGCKRHIKSCKR